MGVTLAVTVPADGPGVLSRTPVVVRWLGAIRDAVWGSRGAVVRFGLDSVPRPSVYRELDAPLMADPARESALLIPPTTFDVMAGRRTPVAAFFSSSAAFVTVARVCRVVAAPPKAPGRAETRPLAAVRALVAPKAPAPPATPGARVVAAPTRPKPGARTEAGPPPILARVEAAPSVLADVTPVPERT